MSEISSGERLSGSGQLPENRVEPVRQLGPAIPDEILFLRTAIHQDVEIVHALALPTGLEGIGKARIRRSIVADIDRRRRALEDVDMTGVAPQVRHGLNGSRARADHADALVREPGHAPGRIAAGVFVVPPTRVKRVPFEVAHGPEYPGAWASNRARSP